MPVSVRPPVHTPFYYGWVVLGTLISAASVAAVGSHPFMAVMLKPISEELGWSRTEVTTAIAMGTMGMGLAAPFVGRLADRFGPRFLLPVGGGLLAGAFILMGQAQALWQFAVAYIVARSIATPMVSGVGAQTTVVNWFARMRGRSMGMLSMTFPLANSVQAPIGQWLVGIIGWRWIFSGLGLLAAVLIIVPGYLLTRRRPEDVGLYPDGASGPPQPGNTAPGRRAAAGGHARNIDFTLPEAIRTRAFWFLVLGNFLAILGGGAISFHQVAYYTDLGLTPAVAAASISLFTLAGAFSSGLWGVLAERFSERMLAVVIMVAAAGTVLGMLQVNSEPQALIWSTLYGLAARGEGALFGLLLASYFGRGHYGTISGFFQQFSGVGLGLGPFVGALAFDTVGSYTSFFLALAATYVVTGLVLLFFVRPPAEPVRASSSA
jgi:MFS family permease